jgi:glycosyltransferase involved in cell wall biosynthesis
MKIILAHCYYRQSGGEDLSFQAHADLLRDRGHEVLIFTRDNQDLEAVNPLQAAATTIWSRQAAAELTGLINASGAELVHFHNTFMAISPAAYYASHRSGAAVVQDLRNYRLLCPVATLVRDGRHCEDCLGKTVPWPGVLHACWHDSHLETSVVAGMLSVHNLLGSWHRKVDMYVALSPSMRGKFIEVGFDEERIAVKPNFLEPPPIVGSGRADFALYVGRLSPEKGIKILLEAWQHIEGIQLKIIGDGPLTGRVRQAAESHPGGQIEYLGSMPRSQVFDWMRRARLLVFPSIWPEPFGNTIIEAMACGLPVLGSRLGSVVDLVEDGRTGLQFAAGDDSDLAAKLRWAMAHPEELERMGKEARQTYQQTYRAAQNYQKLINIYQQAIEIYRERGSARR